METSGNAKELIEHSLNIDPKATQKMKGLRRFTPEWRQAIEIEIIKLQATGFIKEVYIPSKVVSQSCTCEVKRTVMNGGCALTTATSTIIVQMILLGSLGLTKSSTPWLDEY